MVPQQASLIARVTGVAALAALTLPACTMFPTAPGPARAPSRATASSPAPDSSGGSADVAGRPGNAASTALLQQARNEREAGSLAAAAVSVERALRIAPNDPDLWLELAEIKLAGGDPEQAEMMARKALTLAGADRSVAERADRLLTN